MFRKISLTRLLSDNLEAGLLLVNLNEQPVHWYTGDGQLDETYSGYGLFAYGGYNYYPLKDSKDLNLNVGLGLGASSVNYSLKNTVWGYIEQDGNYSYGLVTSETTLKEQFFTLNLSAKVQFTLIDKLWMGIEYDNVIIPGKSKPRISNMQLEEEALGNSSLGITFGLNLR